MMLSVVRVSVSLTCVQDWGGAVLLPATEAVIELEEVGVTAGVLEDSLCKMSF